MANYNISKLVSLLTPLLLLINHFHLACSNDHDPIPADATQVEKWFQTNVQPLASRRGTIDPVLETAEANARIIKVRKDGTGDFKRVIDAIANVSIGNSNRVIIYIGPGNYTEKIRIERTKRFISLYGNPSNPPVLTYAGTAGVYGTMESATFICEADYFNAVNIVFVNNSPRPDGVRKGAQAVAFRIEGEKASIYKCKFHGFQDTVCDDMGKHFFKDCYIEGTVDFVFGNGKSIYLNTELHVIPGDNMAMVTAQARHNAEEDVGYSFVHSKVTGGFRGVAYLGRAWMPYAFTVFSYSELGEGVHPKGWSDNFTPATDKTVYFAEYKNTGPGSSFEQRATFTKKLSDAEVQKFITLAFIEGSTWLLPPIHL